MYGTMTSSLCPHADIEGTLLTHEQVEEISTRISKSILENVSKQLKKALASANFSKDKQKKILSYNDKYMAPCWNWQTSQTYLINLSALLEIIDVESP